MSEGSSFKLVEMPKRKMKKRKHEDTEMDAPDKFTSSKPKPKPKSKPNKPLGPKRSSKAEPPAYLNQDQQADWAKYMLLTEDEMTAIVEMKEGKVAELGKELLAAKNEYLSKNANALAVKEAARDIDRLHRNVEGLGDVIKGCAIVVDRGLSNLGLLVSDDESGSEDNGDEGSDEDE